MKDRIERGRALAETLFGPRERQRAVLPDQLRDYTLGFVFGDLWQQDDMSIEERELCTTAMLGNGHCNTECKRGLSWCTPPARSTTPKASRVPVPHLPKVCDFANWRRPLRVPASKARSSLTCERQSIDQFRSRSSQ